MHFKQIVEIWFEEVADGYEGSIILKGQTDQRIPSTIRWFKNDSHFIETI